MAVCRIVEPGVTPEQYEQVREKLGLGDSAPPGATLHIAAVGDDGNVRIVEVWDSREQADEFNQRVRTAREEAGVGGGPPPMTYLEVHRLIQA
jgi:hypothetical protein